MDEYWPQQPYSYWDQGARVHQVENAKGIVPLMCIMTAAALIAIVFAIVAFDRAGKAEREARIIEDDTKYIRAYLSARGIHVPANHEEAEEK